MRVFVAVVAAIVAAVASIGLATFSAIAGLHSIGNTAREYQDNTDAVYIALGVVLLATAAVLLLIAAFLVGLVIQAWRKRGDSSADEPSPRRKQS
jgi:hypothetical protein